MQVELINVQINIRLTPYHLREWWVKDPAMDCILSKIRAFEAHASKQDCFYLQELAEKLQKYHGQIIPLINTSGSSIRSPIGILDVVAEGTLDRVSATRYKLSELEKALVDDQNRLVPEYLQRNDPLAMF